MFITIHCDNYSKKPANLRHNLTSGKGLETFFKKDHTLLKSIGVEVYEGRVLLTGLVSDEDVRLAQIAVSQAQARLTMDLAVSQAAVEVARASVQMTQAGQGYRLSKRRMPANLAPETSKKLNNSSEFPVPIIRFSLSDFHKNKVL